MCYTYIVECADHTLYTGWTNNLPARIHTHNEGHGAKYTRSRLPVTLVYFEEHESKSEAMRREYAIKRLTRDEKVRLVSTMDLDFLKSMQTDIANPHVCFAGTTRG